MLFVITSANGNFCMLHCINWEWEFVKLTSIELFENWKYYANHPLIKSQYKNGAFTSLDNAFAMCLSDAALTFFEQWMAMKLNMSNSFIVLQCLSAILPGEHYFKPHLPTSDSSPVALVEGAWRRALGEGNANNEEATGKSGTQNGDRCNGGRRRWQCL